MPDLRVSIVTPSFNQARYLEETIRSVLDGGVPDVEHVVIDGGSTDASPDILRRYSDRLSYWCSEKDKGQYDAINKGFAHTTGDILGWLNSDDRYLPGALSVVREIFGAFPEIQWLTTCYPVHWDGQSRLIRCKYLPGFSSKAFRRGENIPGAGWKGTTAFIQQESTFWRRSLWEQAGGRVDDSLDLIGDFELWLRFYRHAELYGVEAPLGGFRSHGDQKTGARLDRYTHECRKLLLERGGSPPGRLGSVLRDRGLKFLPDGVAKATGWKEPRRVVRHAGGDRGWRLQTI